MPGHADEGFETESAFGYVSGGDTTDLYVQLGECLWKKSDREGAKLSFEQCLKSSDKEIVKFGKRNLSIILRQIAAAGNGDREQKTALKEKSIALAKEAIQLDFKDGYSWYILGNAHFSQFFSEGQNWDMMKQALQAYKNAFKDASSNYNCDLHFNQAVLFKFQEKYQQALHSFQFALKLDPVWEEAKAECSRLENLLSQMNDLVSKNGGLKKKQFDKIVSKFDDSQLGPFLTSFKDPKNDKSVQLTKCHLDDLETIAASDDCLDLRSSFNDNKVCLLKVAAEVGTEATRPPYHCIAVDEKECLCVLSVFNAANTFHLQRSDSVAIAQPFVSAHNFSFQPSINAPGQASDGSVTRSEVAVSFRLIRVNSPADLVVNGRRASKNLEAFVSIGVQAKAS